MKHINTTDVPTIIIDTREQKPYAFSELIPVQRHALPKGDYSILGAEHCFAIERKSLDDWLHTIVHCSGRFAKELAELADYHRAYIVVEGDWQAILRQEYNSKTLPQAAMHMSLSIMQRYDIPIITAGDRPTAREVVEYLCLDYARKHMRAAQGVKAL